MNVEAQEILIRNIPAVSGSLIYWIGGWNWAGIIVSIWVIIQAIRFVQKWVREDREYRRQEKLRGYEKTDRAGLG